MLVKSCEKISGQKLEAYLHEFPIAVLKLLCGCTDGRVKLWVYAVTAVGFILILFIITLSFLVWYVPYYFLVHFTVFREKSSIVAYTPYK